MFPLSHLKICLINEFFYPDSGSTPKLLSELLRKIKDDFPETEIDVITTRNLYRGETKLKGFEDWKGIKITRLDLPASNRFRPLRRFATGLYFSILAFMRLMIRKKYNVVLVCTNPPSAPLAAFWYMKLTHTPYVYLVHDLYPDIGVAIKLISKDRLIVRIARKQQHAWLRSAAKVIVLGRCMRSYLYKKYGFSPSLTEVIPNWANPEYIHPAPKETQFRQRHNLKGFVVFYSGSLGQSHGIDTLLEAARIVNDLCSDVTFVLVGSGAERGNIERRIRLSRTETIRFFPPVDAAEYPELLASADICLVSLRAGAEGLSVPCKFYSYLAAGRPIIGILDRASEIAHVLEESECGIQVNSDNPKELADAVIRLRNSPELADRMGKNGRRTLIEKYTLKHSAERYHQVLVNAASCRKYPRGKPRGIKS